MHREYRTAKRNGLGNLIQCIHVKYELGMMVTADELGKQECQGKVFLPVIAQPVGCSHSI